MEYLEKLIELYENGKYHGFVCLVDRANRIFYGMDYNYITIECKEYELKVPIALVQVLLSVYLIDADKVWRYTRLLGGYQVCISQNGDDRVVLTNFANDKVKITTRKDFDILEFIRMPWRD
jgi:hypothetical protein